MDQRADAGAEEADRDGQRVDQKPTSTFNDPDWNHTNRVCVKKRSSAGRSARPTKTTTVDTNEPAIIAGREPSPRAARPACGRTHQQQESCQRNAGINQTASSMRGHPFNTDTSSALTCGRRRKIATMIASPTTTSARHDQHEEHRESGLPDR
jgi:hypothetical protein